MARLLKKLQRQDENIINLDTENLAIALPEKVLVFLEEKINSRKLEVFSLRYCRLGLAPLPTFIAILDLIEKANVDTICLTENKFELLDRNKLALLLKALNKSSIREISLESNHLGSLIATHPDLFQEFLKNNSSNALNFSKNNLGDKAPNSAKILALHSQINCLDLTYNRLSSDYITSFLSNCFSTKVYLAGNRIDDGNKKEVLKKCKENRTYQIELRRRRFVDEAIVVAQGAHCETSSLSKLPKDIIKLLLSYLANDIKTKKRVNKASMFILDTIGSLDKKFNNTAIYELKKQVIGFFHSKVKKPMPADVNYLNSQISSNRAYNR